MSDMSLHDWRAHFARARYTGTRLTTATRLLLDEARAGRTLELRDSYARFVHWTGEVAHHPERVEAKLLSDFFTEFARLASNLGRPPDDSDSLAALNAAIDVQKSNGLDVSALHLAKARYLRTFATESSMRLEALEQAVAAAPVGSTEWAEALESLSAYQIEISRYDEAIILAQRFTSLPDELQRPSFRCAAKLLEGSAVFTTFQDHPRAERLLEAACEYTAGGDNDPQLRRWLATAFHYLARVVDVRGDHAQALGLYLKGKAYLDSCPEDIEATVFVHLRLSEPLIASGALADARDHLDEASRLVRTSTNVSSSRLQLSLGHATLQAAHGDMRNAHQIAEQARRRARGVGFWRGELLCLGYLLALAVRRRRPIALAITAARIGRTALFGELRRNKLTKLIRSAPSMLKVVLSRMRNSPAKADKAVPVERCPCELHTQPR